MNGPFLVKHFFLIFSGVSGLREDKTTVKQENSCGPEPGNRIKGVSRKAAKNAEEILRLYLKPMIRPFFATWRLCAKIFCRF
jgi:hypothetical protein